MGDCLWSQKNDLGWARTEAKPYIGMFSTCKSTNISHCHHSYVWAYIFVSDVMLSDHSALGLALPPLAWLRPSRAWLWPPRAWLFPPSTWLGQTDERNFSPFYRALSPIGAAAQKRKI